MFVLRPLYPDYRQQTTDTHLPLTFSPSYLLIFWSWFPSFDLWFLASVLSPPVISNDQVGYPHLDIDYSLLDIGYFYSIQFSPDKLGGCVNHMESSRVATVNLST